MPSIRKAAVTVLASLLIVAALVIVYSQQKQTPQPTPTPQRKPTPTQKPDEKLPKCDCYIPLTKEYGVQKNGKCNVTKCQK